MSKRRKDNRRHGTERCTGSRNFGAELAAWSNFFSAFISSADSFGNHREINTSRIVVLLVLPLALLRRKIAAKMWRFNREAININVKKLHAIPLCAGAFCASSSATVARCSVLRRVDSIEIERKTKASRYHKTRCPILSGGKGKRREGKLRLSGCFISTRDDSFALLHCSYGRLVLRDCREDIKLARYGPGYRISMPIARYCLRISRYRKYLQFPILHERILFSYVVWLYRTLLLYTETILC